MNEWEDYLPDDLFEVTEQLRNRTHKPTELRLDELKRQILARSTADLGPAQGRRFILKRKFVTLSLVLGLTLGGGAAGVIAAGGDQPTSPSQTQYKCNSGNGNGAEFGTPPGKPQGSTGTQTSPDCDPGNSATHNLDNTSEGPPNSKGR